MADREIQHVSYFQVDNPLVTTINPIREYMTSKIGYVSRSLTKTGPFEKLGNFVSTEIGYRL